MSETYSYSYRDARLSLWQTAADQVFNKRTQQSKRSDSASRVAKTRSQTSGPINKLMFPVHVAGHALENVGKPFGFLLNEVEKGFLGLMEKFHPVDDCARAAARFLWAEVEGNEADSRLYKSVLEKAVCDGAGWTECLTTYLGYKALLQDPMYRPDKGRYFDLGTNTKVAIIGDWGTGEDVARNVLRQVASLKPDVLLHLGDVYYAGTRDEAQHNFLDICRSTLGEIPLFSLCGNHDMYSGGQGYYWLLDQIGQEASYFCLRNDDWLFLAMDTGFHDNNPFNVSTNMTTLVSTEGWSEATWLQNQLKNAGNRKIVLLSHHQLFSPFGSVGAVNDVAYAYNPNLYEVFAPALPQVEWWFWGHEHTLGIFPQYMGLKRGRCLGASAVPVFSDQQQYALAKDLKTLDDGPMPTWDNSVELGVTKNMYNNCFALMTLNSASATVDYYEVPLLRTAQKLVVTDNV